MCVCVCVWVCVCVCVCVCVETFRRTLTWTTGSLTCICDLFACVFLRRGGGPRSIVLFERLMTRTLIRIVLANSKDFNTCSAR